MKKSISAICLLLLSATAFAQAQQFYFTPQWKTGDKKTILTTIMEESFENDELVSKDSTLDEMVIKVLKETKDGYEVEILQENMALKAAAELSKKIREYLPQYQNLKLIYHIHKKDGKAELTNWQEVQDFMKKSLSEITKVLEEKEPQMAPYASIIFSPVEKIYASKESMETSMNEHLRFLFIPIGQQFTLGDSIKIEETAQNPFNPEQNINSTTYYWLENVNEKEKTCQVNQSVVLNLSEFIEMMKSMMHNMSQAMGADENMTKEKSKEFDDFKMDMANLQTIYFDYQTTWPTKVVHQITIVAANKKRSIVSTGIVR